jgi:hypothetical protein
VDHYQDGRRCRVGNSSECYKMSNCHPIFMKLDTKTKTDILSSKITEAEVWTDFQDGRRRHFGNSSAWYEMGICLPIEMKIGAQTQKHAEFKNHRSGSDHPLFR